jgi:hypothetical protein
MSIKRRFRSRHAWNSLLERFTRADATSMLNALTMQAGSLRRWVVVVGLGTAVKRIDCRPKMIIDALRTRSIGLD